MSSDALKNSVGISALPIDLLEVVLVVPGIDSVSFVCAGFPLPLPLLDVDRPIGQNTLNGERKLSQMTRPKSIESAKIAYNHPKACGLL